MRFNVIKCFGFSLTFFIFSQYSCSQKKEQLMREEQPKSETYPKNDFRNPLGITNYLAGNFGELRANHFHSGLDIKTNQREGYNVYAAGKGYISRINVSPRGYGNALYIDHPNGYTTVYAHLQKFNSQIEEIVRKYQYQKENFVVEILLSANELIVNEGDIIALSGNSGGSAGPHLHFEIRHTQTEEPINPFYFGFDVPDTKAPAINGLYLYALNGDVAGNKGRYTLPSGLNFKSPIYASGKVGVGIRTNDQHNGAINRNGTHQIEVIVNNKTIFTFTSNRVAFSETRAINSICDFSSFMQQNTWIYQCFVTDGNPLRMYSNLENNGIIDLEDGKQYDVQIIASDYAGNKATASYTLIGKTPPTEEKVIENENRFHWNKENYFKADGIEISFPEGLFYEDFDFNYKKSGVKHYVGDWNFPVHSYYTLALEPENIPTAQLDKAVIVNEYKKNGAWRKSYEKAEYKNGKVVAHTRDFGVFSVEIDNTKPNINPINIKNNSTFTSANSRIRFTISDSQSGIQGFAAYIDDKWILAVYDAKYKSLSIDLNKEGISVGKHQLELKVWDDKNNTASYITSFTKSS